MSLGKPDGVIWLVVEILDGERSEVRNRDKYARVLEGKQRFARTDKPASSQTAVLGSPYESSAGSTRTRQGRGKGWYLALETQGQAVPYPSPWGKPDRPGGLGHHLGRAGQLGPQ